MDFVVYSSIMDYLLRFSFYRYMVDNQDTHDGSELDDKVFGVSQAVAFISSNALRRRDWER